MFRMSTPVQLYVECKCQCGMMLHNTTMLYYRDCHLLNS